MDLVVPELILVDMKAEKKEEAFGELTDALVREGAIPFYDNFLYSIKKAEELGTSGSGFGIAIPRTRFPEIDRHRLIIGISQVGIEWDSLDEQPVYLVFLEICPPECPVEHLKYIELLSRSLRSETFRRFLAQSYTVDAVWQLLQDSDDGLFDA